MTREDIINRLYENVGLPKKDASQVLAIILDTLKNTLAADESIKISNFGTFNIRRKHSRLGRNPRTGQEIEIPYRRVVLFRPSKYLKMQIQ